MKKIYLFIFAATGIVHSAFSQLGDWTWISGSSAVNATGVYGTQGTPATTNHPEAIYDALAWKDNTGNFWIYGGTIPLNCDLWKFNPSTLQWTWVKGNKMANQATVYGTQGVAATANTPGVRSYTAATWVDTSGNLWLMGGNGQYDDMWKYTISTNMWTWVKGTNTNQYSVHGTQGTAAAANTPGNRDGTCSAWTDASNNLWLYGGFGYEDDGAAGGLEDVWKYNIATNNWTWMKGSQYINPSPVYGTKAVAAGTNEPGGRFTYTKWKDSSGNFWLFGGLDWTNFDVRNDVWKYNITTNKWTWMAGPQTLGDTGTYPATCSYTTTGTPDSRWYSQSAVTDNCGKFWLFGGGGDDDNLNDLWVFDPAVVKWNLVRGPGRMQTGSYGTKGTASAANMPIARFGAVAWWGTNNKFYMFGGQGASQSDIYGDMWMFTPDTICAPTCSSATLPVPVAAFEASKKTLCANDSTDFTDLSTNATSWIWTFDGGNDSTSSDENPQDIQYPSGGTYDVTLVAYNAAGVTDTASSANYITVQSVLQPVILNNADTLYFHPDVSYVSYQWYENAATIPGATDTIYYIGSDSSTFSVVVKTSNDCSNSATYSLRALPITLLDFNAVLHDDVVDILWSTASEINNNFFTVERTKDGIDFTTVAKINGAGTSSSLLNYHVIDEHPLQGISYYRLKQTDFDGHYTYSQLVAVKNTTDNSGFMLFPNPANDQVTISSSSFYFHQPLTISLMNMLGEIMQVESLEWSGALNMNIKTLPSGIYFLQLQSEWGNTVKRFVKQ